MLAPEVVVVVVEVEDVVVLVVVVTGIGPNSRTVPFYFYFPLTDQRLLPVQASIVNPMIFAASNVLIISVTLVAGNINAEGTVTTN